MGWWFLHGPPGLQNAPVASVERKVIAAAGRLIVRPADRDFAVVAEQQSADGPMADDEHVAAWCPIQNRLHPPHDPRLGIDGRLPAAHACPGVAKKASTTTSNSAAGRKPVAERSFSCMASLTSMLRPRAAPRISAVSMALRSALAMICDVPDSHPAAASAVTRSRPTALKDHSGTGMVGSISTCGCVR